ncbi:HTH-type transcriptional repressor CytR [Stieleria maiorica]|uniref:HTH-type transcriptional repressor CytR n=1 Tax=Stieleria maiorica TaxID=2795974 RepID=A0A5B9MKH8_9BACT|nr:LacI family DNA-binding transcriptional regulator [Stieleria maiorica]QEF99457.1 HTH-type transcriptional repressor CytR [Stieleria maiorica]
MPAKPVTLKNVAERAGVSVSTASRALNGQARKYRISPTTEKAVRKVADDLGFQASQVARSLRLKRSGLIGVIVPDVSNPFFASIARQVSLGVEASGFSVLLGDSREETAIEQRLARQLRAKQVEALLVCPVGVRCDHLIDVDRSGLPVVVVDRVFEEIELPCVTSDNLRAARELAEVLIHAGHRKIGVLSGVRESLPAKTRLQGLKDAAEQAGFAIDPSYVAGDAFTEQSGYQATRELLDRHPDLTAIFAMCNPAAIGAIRALTECGYTVPHDCSVVAFDDHPSADLMKTPLTVAVQDISRLGRLATDVLLRRLGLQPSGHGVDATASSSSVRAVNARSNSDRWQVPTTLLERASVAEPCR